MARKKREPNRVDELLDELLADCQSPEEILGESGILKQLSKRLIERALVGELNYHLKQEESDSEEPIVTAIARRNSRNGYSKKTIQSEQGEIELAIPRDPLANIFWRETLLQIWLPTENLSRCWCPNINAVCQDSMRRYWPSMRGV